MDTQGVDLSTTAVDVASGAGLAGYRRYVLELVEGEPARLWWGTDFPTSTPEYYHSLADGDQVEFWFKPGEQVPWVWLASGTGKLAISEAPPVWSGENA